MIAGAKAKGGTGAPAIPKGWTGADGEGIICHFTCTLADIDISSLGQGLVSRVSGFRVRAWGPCRRQHMADGVGTSLLSAVLVRQDGGEDPAASPAAVHVCCKNAKAQSSAGFCSVFIHRSRLTFLKMQGRVPAAGQHDSCRRHDSGLAQSPQG